MNFVTVSDYLVLPSLRRAELCEWSGGLKRIRFTWRTQTKRGKGGSLGSN